MANIRNSHRRPKRFVKNDIQSEPRRVSKTHLRNRGANFNLDKFSTISLHTTGLPRASFSNQIHETTLFWSRRIHFMNCSAAIDGVGITIHTLAPRSLWSESSQNSRILMRLCNTRVWWHTHASHHLSRTCPSIIYVACRAQCVAGRIIGARGRRHG